MVVWGWFYFLPFNNAFITICVPVFVCICFHIYLGVELLDHMVTVFNILRNCQTVFQSNCPIYISTSNVGEFQFLTSLPTVVIVCLFDWSCTCGPEVVLICIFPDGRWCRTSFHVLIGHSHIVFGDTSVQIVCLSLNWVISLFVVGL